MHEPSNHENRLSCSRIIATIYDRKSCLVCANSQCRILTPPFIDFQVIQGGEPSGFKCFTYRRVTSRLTIVFASSIYQMAMRRTTQQSLWGKGLPHQPRKNLKPRGQKVREAKKQLSELYSTVSPTLLSSRSVTPSTFEQPALTVAVGKQLQSDHQVHELPADDASDCSSLPAGFQSYSHPQTEVLVNTTLLAHIEYLESENARLKKKNACPLRD